MVGFGSKNTKNRCKICGKFVHWGDLFLHLVNVHEMDRYIAATTPLKKNFDLIIGENC